MAARWPATATPSASARSGQAHGILGSAVISAGRELPWRRAFCAWLDFVLYFELKRSLRLRIPLASLQGYCNCKHWVLVTYQSVLRACACIASRRLVAGLKHASLTR